MDASASEKKCKRHSVLITKGVRSVGNSGLGRMRAGMQRSSPERFRVNQEAKSASDRIAADAVARNDVKERNIRFLKKGQPVLSGEVLSIPESVFPLKTYILSKRIAAIRLTRDVEGYRGKLGDIIQLQPGARLDWCGVGYNGRTIKVYYAGDFYFVFLQDVDELESNSC